jgi:putative transposase
MKDGATDKDRQSAYLELLRYQDDAVSLKAIREAVNSGTALGSERFKDEIEVVIGRSIRPGKPGHPRKLGGDK